MSLEAVGSLTLFQYTSLITDLRDKDKSITYNNIIAARASQLDDESFKKLLVGYECWAFNSRY